MELGSFWQGKVDIHGIVCIWWSSGVFGKGRLIFMGLFVFGGVREVPLSYNILAFHKLKGTF